MGHVCAYANNQHQLGKDIGSDPRESSFYQALVLCDGVLVVLDAKATPFTRIWCAFEEATAVTMDDAARPGKGHFLLDIATVPSGNPEKAELLTDGLSPEEQKHIESVISPFIFPIMEVLKRSRAFDGIASATTHVQAYLDAR